MGENLVGVWLYFLHHDSENKNAKQNKKHGLQALVEQLATEHATLGICKNQCLCMKTFVCLVRYVLALHTSAHRMYHAHPKVFCTCYGKMEERKETSLRLQG